MIDAANNWKKMTGHILVYYPTTKHIAWKFSFSILIVSCFLKSQSQVITIILHHMIEIL